MQMNGAPQHVWRCFMLHLVFRSSMSCSSDPLIEADSRADWKYPDIPNIDTWKWLDSRRMTNVCERWAQDHTNALQGAWFNGESSPLQAGST